MKPSVHRKLAYDAARGQGFSDEAAKIIAIGAVAPDQSDWETAAAHGQTPNDANGYPTMTPDQAVAAFDQYVQEKIAQIDASVPVGRIDGSVSFGNPAEALYRIGYTMHAFQDLAAHMGMTNYTHSYLAKEGHDPDVDPDRIARAKTWSTDFLLRGASHWALSWEMLQRYKGPGPDDFDRFSTAISNGSADRTYESLISYLWSRFSTHNPPSGGWGGIQEIENIRSAALNEVAPAAKSPQSGSDKNGCEERNRDAIAKSGCSDCFPRMMNGREYDPMPYALLGGRCVQIWCNGKGPKLEDCTK